MQAGFRIIKRVLDILQQEERRKLFFLCLMVVGMSLVEFFGVVSILPFISVAMEPGMIHSNVYLSTAYRFLGFSSETTFLVFLGSGSLMILVLGNAFRAFSSFLLLRFSYLQSHFLGERILRTYLYKRYELLMSQNSSDLSKTILAEVSQVVNGIMIPGLRAFGRAVTALALIVLLTWINPVVAFVIAIALSAFYLIIYRLLKGRIQELGKNRIKYNKKRFRVLSEISGGIKELKLMNKEEAYLREFKNPSENVALIQAYSTTIGDLPRYLLEVIVFGGMLSLIIYLIYTQGQSSGISVAALYAFAGYKLMPALQEIFLSATKIRLTLPVLSLVENSLSGEVDRLDQPNNLPVLFNDSVTLRDVSFSYIGATSKTLSSVSIRIKANSTVGIIGPTGSGKTTLVDLVLGLLTPTAGKILIDGIELNEGNIRCWQSYIGYVPQYIYLVDDTIERNIAFGVPVELIDRGQVIRASRLAQLEDFIMNKAPEGYNTVVGERGVRLSGGQRQRIGVARALYHNPRLIVFDEATSALDHETERALMDSIDVLYGKKTILMIAHRFSTLGKADQIIRVSNGSVVDITGEFKVQTLS